MAHGAAAFAAARCACGAEGSNGCKPFVPEAGVEEKGVLRQQHPSEAQQSETITCQNRSDCTLDGHRHDYACRCQYVLLPTCQRHQELTGGQ